MKNTERLVGIALAVLALEGCRGPQQHAGAPGPRPSSTASPSGVGHAGYHSGGGHLGGFAAGAAAGAAAGSQRRGFGTDRSLGGRNGSSAAGEDGENGRGGGFGSAGAHGSGG